MSQAKWENIQWTELAEGSYNKVYLSADKKHVLKIQKSNLNERDIIPDQPDRSVLLWNEINPDFPAETAQTKMGKGWGCPYIVGVSPSDVTITKTIIDIFNRTGRIVLDAPVAKNFKRMRDGRVICIDIGLALKMEQRERVVYPNQLTRSKSTSSLEVRKNFGDKLDQFFNKAWSVNPITTNTIRALLFIQSKRPDILDVSFLVQSPDLIKLFAMGYTQQNTQKALERLDQLASSRFAPLYTIPNLTSNTLGVIPGVDLEQTFKALPSDVTALDLRTHLLNQKTTDKLIEVFKVLPKEINKITLSLQDLASRSKEELIALGKAMPHNIEVQIADNSDKLINHDSLDELRKHTGVINKGAIASLATVLSLGDYVTNPESETIKSAQPTEISLIPRRDKQDNVPTSHVPNDPLKNASRKSVANSSRLLIRTAEVFPCKWSGSKLTLFENTAKDSMHKDTHKLKRKTPPPNMDLPSSSQVAITYVRHVCIWGTSMEVNKFKSRTSYLTNTIPQSLP